MPRSSTPAPADAVETITADAHDDETADETTAVVDPLRAFKAAKAVKRSSGRVSITAADADEVAAASDAFEDTDPPTRDAVLFYVSDRRFVKRGDASTAGNNTRNETADMIGTDPGWITASTAELEDGWTFGLYRNVEPKADRSFGAA
jgi:hypothetical protein